MATDMIALLFLLAKGLTSTIDRAEAFVLSNLWDSCRVPVYRTAVTGDSFLLGDLLPDMTDFGTGFFLDAARFSSDSAFIAAAETAATVVLSHRLAGDIWRHYPSRNDFPADIDNAGLLAFGVLVWLSDTSDNWDTLQTVKGPNGAYGTWLGVPIWHQDTCAVCNAQLARWIATSGHRDPSLDSYLCSQADSPSLRYYRNSLWFWYVWAKYYRDCSPQGFTTYLIQRTRNRIVDSIVAWYPWNYNPLYTAIAITALLSLGYRGKSVVWKGISFLRKSQRPDGSWPAFVCWTGADRCGCFGSDVLTTIFVLEALYMHRRTPVGPVGGTIR